MKILVWGRGIKFSLLRDRFIDMNKVIGFVDNNTTDGTYLGKKVYNPSEIVELEYDALIIASNSTEEIYTQCIELGIDISKTIFVYKNWKFEPLVDNTYLVEQVFGEDFARFLLNKYHIVNSPTLDEINYGNVMGFEHDRLYQDDYVRVRTLIMVAKEICENNVEGDVAEFGVFRGDFAKNINIAFPDRKLWLFDTFGGFDSQEADKELKKGTVNNSYICAFQNTNEAIVMDKMEHPENVIIKKGVFPGTTNLVETKFSFVSIDVDLEESTFAGLEYFYPRLSVGGFIFIHDYNYGYFDAVKKAVQKYELDHGVRLIKVPLCDYDGTVVIAKN